MQLREIFPKSKTDFPEIVEKYSVVNFEPGLRMRDRVPMQCSACGHVFTQRANNIFSQGTISCKCSKSYRRTKEELLADAIDFVNTVDLELISITYTRPLCNSTLSLQCTICNSYFEKSFQNLYYNNSGCVRCSGKYQPTLQEYLEKITSKLGAKFKLISDLTGRPTKNDFISVECLCCNKISSKSIAAIIYMPPACPYCAVYGYDETTSGYMYLIKLFNETSEYFKIGVTGNLKRRFAELSGQNNLSLEVLNTWEYNSHEPILKHESFLKDNFALGRVVDKPFEYGYTEIVSKEHLPVILTLQNLQYRNMRSGFSS